MADTPKTPGTGSLTASGKQTWKDPMSWGEKLFLQANAMSFFGGYQVIVDGNSDNMFAYLPGYQNPNNPWDGPVVWQAVTIQGWLQAGAPRQP